MPFHHNLPMNSVSHSIWWPRLGAFVLSALAAASLVYWGLKWSSTGAPPVAASLPPVDMAGTDPQALARALGGGKAMATPTAPNALAIDASSRMALVGVVANRRNGGTALISVDGKPARPYPVGARVDENLVLQSVAPRRAVLAAQLDGAASVTLELPASKK